MSSTDHPECLSEDELLAVSQGRLTGPQVAHIAACASCSNVVAYLGRQLAPKEGHGQAHGPGASPSADRCVLGQYELIGLVGTGTMGKVYSAWDTVRQEKVAIKLLLPSEVDLGRLEERLRREAKALSRIHHPNVVRVIGMERSELGLVLVMEFIEGQTLQSWLTGIRRPWRQVLAAFVEAGRGLSAVHEAHIVHRDFKPANVLVTPAHRVVLTDFGLAGWLPGSRSLPPPPLTVAGTLVGSPAYMAPECVSGEAGPRSDLFSFCVALYEALWNTMPFPIDAIHARLSGVRRDPTPPPATDVPAHVREATLAGLSFEPEDRPASMEALLGLLGAST